MVIERLADERTDEGNVFDRNRITIAALQVQGIEADAKLLVLQLAFHI